MLTGAQSGERETTLAIMSTKGMASTAARTLIDNLCQHQVPLLVLHDLDKAGLSILGTLSAIPGASRSSSKLSV